MRMRTQEHAQLALVKLNQMIETAKITPEIPWQEACEKGTQAINNIQYYLQGQPLKEMTLFEILDDIYRMELEQIGTFSPPDTNAEIDELLELIPLLPQSLPWKPIEDPDPKQLLFTNLWATNDEDEDLDLDLGDDGTDEMQQSLDMVYHLLHAFVDPKIYEHHSLITDPIYCIERWMVQDVLLNENDQPYFSAQLNLGVNWNILRYYAAQENTYREASTFLINYIIEDESIHLTLPEL